MIKIINDLNPEKNRYNLKDFPETQYKTFSDSWFKECFKTGCKANTKQKATSKQIVIKYKIGGICDPAYIANLICLYPDWVDRLFFCYNTCIKRIHNKTQYKSFMGVLK